MSEHDDMPPIDTRTADAYRRQYPTREQIVAKVLFKHWETVDWTNEERENECVVCFHPGQSFADHLAAEVVQALDAHEGVK